MICLSSHNNLGLAFFRLLLGTSTLSWVSVTFSNTKPQMMYSSFYFLLSAFCLGSTKVQWALSLIYLLQSPGQFSILSMS